MSHTKAVLFVDDHQAQSLKLDGILNHGMCAHEYLYGAVDQSLKHLLALSALDDAREQLYADGHIAQELLDSLQMLLSQYLGGSHDAGLIAVVQGNEHRHQRHQRLSRTHVALQQAVHLAARAHVGPDLMHHALLGSRQFEGQVFLVEIVEQRSYTLEHISLILAAVVAGIS